ncbi:MAG: DegT/DnrJ/EryC1/StrS family aminotransferase [Candidatus Omnitrophica bacterium]|nr:DegT/DnrJ/EryC1/StrS family aminotransferase [Candidatus Omnitrophota bacterium]
MPAKFKVPLLDLKREYAFLKKDIAREIRACFSTQSWILGEKVTALEAAASRYLGTKYALGVASGTDALLIALRICAFQLKKEEGFFKAGDEIITTPFTFIATAETIVRAGATPVFVDIDPLTFNISAAAIEKAINQNTRGIIPVHLYGLSCDLSAILKIARKHNLFVIEDAAQSFGAEYKGKKLGSLGDIGCFSFFPSKNLGAYGDGGLIATDTEADANLAKILRNHGQVNKYDAHFLGYNSRLDSIQAAVLLAKLKHIDTFNGLRNKIASKYRKALGDIASIQLPAAPSDCSHAYHLYNIMVPSGKRDNLLSHLASCGIESRVYYPLPLYKMKAFTAAKRAGSFKNTERALLSSLTLPLHPFLKDEEVKYVTGKIREFFAL